MLDKMFIRYIDKVFTSKRTADKSIPRSSVLQDPEVIIKIQTSK